MTTNVDEKILAHIGFDDIDTPFGGCTTHFTALLLEKWIRENKIQLIDYPNLIRLNPGVPWKTRGNGALVIRFLVEDEAEALDRFNEAIVFAEQYLKEYRHPQSQPVAGIYLGEVTGYVKWFGEKAVKDFIPLSLLERILVKISDTFKYYSFKQGKRGIIGVLGGIGYRMIDCDYTFELIAYRSDEYFGKPRAVNPDSVKRMDKILGNETILNYDYEIDKPLITPHGADPVLLGIRGETAEAVIKAYNLIEVNEPVPLRVIYRTNQHTDAHLRIIESLEEAYIYSGVRIKAVVSRKPRRIQGGHVVFTITDGIREIDVAAYEPTGRFRNVVDKLLPGDGVEVMGIVRPPSSRHSSTINLEKIYIIKLKPLIKLENPRCPKCGARMKSAGRNKGYKCPKCGYRDPNAKKIVRVIERKSLSPGWYQPPPRCFKHLMKPVQRFGKEKKGFPRIFIPEKFIWVNNELLK